MRLYVRLSPSVALLAAVLLAGSACGRRESGTRAREAACPDEGATSWVRQLLAYEDDERYDDAWDALVDLTVDHETCAFADAIALLAEGLASEDEFTRFAAASGLGLFERRALGTTERLIAVALADPDPETRGRAVWALGEIAAPPQARAIALFGAESVKPAPPEKDPALAARAEQRGLEAVVKALEDEDPDVRKEALEAVACWGAHARSAAERIVPFLADPDAGTRYDALLALRYVGAPAEVCVDSVARLLRDPRPTTRRAAAFLLRDFGTAAADAVPALKDALEDPEVRDAAGKALDAVYGDVEERPIEPPPPAPPPGAG